MPGMAVERIEIDPQSKFSWIDITNPTKEELDAIGEEYHINRHIIRDCLDPNHLPKHEKLNDCVFLIVRLFSSNIKAHVDSLQELTTKIAIFYNEHFLITIHRLQHSLADDVRKEELLKNGDCTTHNLVTNIVRYALRSFEQPAMTLGEQIDAYETTVLLKHTKPALLQGLYYIKRKASTCKKVLLLTDDLVNFLKTTQANNSSVQDVRDLYTMLLTLYDQVLEDVNNLLSTYLSLTTQKTNEVMKVLTIFSVFFMPLTFIVGVYGMNFRFMPELGTRYGYPTVLVLMLVISAGLFLWMKKRRWL
jgi:magnesium transporter